MTIIFTNALILSNIFACFANFAYFCSSEIGMLKSLHMTT